MVTLSIKIIKKKSHPPEAEMFWSSYVCFGLLFAASCSRLICAQTNFFMGTNSSPCRCSNNLICLGDAHATEKRTRGKNVEVGSLSLLSEIGSFAEFRTGLAYYSQPIRMLNPSTGQSASFNTSFAFAVTDMQALAPDGMSFVISANNYTVGDFGGSFGFFQQGYNNFNSVVVEFDSWLNEESPMADISDNHVSLDFRNISAVVSRNASDVDVVFLSSKMNYAWVEYSAKTQQLEVRISTDDSRPSRPFLSHKVNLFEVVDEYMWVGFSGATGDDNSCQYYIQNWIFDSDGISGTSHDPASEPNNAVRESTKPRSRVGIILGISVAVVALLLAIATIFILYYLRRLRPSGRGSLIRGWLLKSQLDREDRLLEIAALAEAYQFSYKQLSVATEAFSERSKLGQGGFGSVYRGVLASSGIAIAVKRISGESSQGEKEFMAEVLIISQLRHRNVIQLLGWCKHQNKYLIVYELMPNGSLDQVLFDPEEKNTPLSWLQRLNIIRGTAAAVDYLHQGWNRRVLHRDIKCSNIMLDAEWNAKLGDFGLARLVDPQRTAISSLVAGTCGYIAPEAVALGKFTVKTDVYAFGIVALEIVCGRRSLSMHMPPNGMALLDWVWQRLSEGDLLSVVDTRLGDYDSHWMEVLLLLGLICCHPDPLARPDMRHVLHVLAGVVAVPSVPTSKPAAVSLSGGPRLSIPLEETDTSSC